MLRRPCVALRCAAVRNTQPCAGSSSTTPLTTQHMSTSSVHGRPLLCAALVLVFTLALISPADASLIRGNHTNNWAVLVLLSHLSALQIICHYSVHNHLSFHTPFYMYPRLHHHAYNHVRLIPHASGSTTAILPMCWVFIVPSNDWVSQTLKVFPPSTFSMHSLFCTYTPALLSPFLQNPFSYIDACG